MQHPAFILLTCCFAVIFTASGEGEIKFSVRNAKIPDAQNATRHKAKSVEHLQPKPDMLNPPECPLLPYFVGFKGKSFSSKIDVYDLLKRISNEIGSPDVITGKETLDGFVAAVNLLRTASFQMIKEISMKIERGTKTWSVFRDAVSQAGTGPAFSMIKEWILSGHVQGEEAAQILSVIPNTVQHPTEQYMNAFFELATHEKVTSQKMLNTSAILSFTNTMRKVVVNKESAKNRFPVYAFGRFTPQNEILSQKYLQYLSHKLSESVAQGDGPKIQVYIRALGNTAHEDIFKIYEPYLEGKIKISDFQRLTMITSMDKVVLTRPRHAHSVLYNIYQNLGEKTEMRVASVIQIMKMNPTASVLQRMAQFTNSDHNRQVSSVVKSSIEQASRLSTLQTQKLSQRAQSAVNLLTTKEFGMQYSKNFLASSQIDGLGYKAEFSYIQGKDSIVPSSIFYNHKRNMGGLKRQNFQMAFMSSSSDDLLNLLLDHLAEYPQKKEHIRHNETKWTWENMEKMFNFELDYAKHVEGNILFTTMGGRRFFPFDNSTIESIRQDLKTSSDTFRLGKTFNYTKMYNQHEITLSFPTMTGLPFVYSLNFPSMIDLNGQIRFKAHPDVSFGNKSEIFTPRTFNASIDVDFVYSSKLQGKAGFVSPFSSQEYVSGVDKNFQIHLPVHLDLNVDRKNEQIQGKARLLDIKNNKIFECSSKPWTSVHNISSLKYEKRFLMAKNERFERTLGQKSTGVALDLKMEGSPNMMMNRDVLSSLLYPSYEDSLSNHNMTLSLNKKQTNSKSARFSFSYKNVVNEDKKLKAGRMDEIAAKASEAIKDSETNIVDAEVCFEGGQNFTATAALSSSHVSQKTRFMAWISHTSKEQGKPFNMSFKLESDMPKVPLDNYEKAIKADPTSKINAILDYNLKDEMTSVSLEGKLERTSKRTEFLKNHPVSKDCFEEMSKGNLLGLSCRNVTANANFLDRYSFNIKYKNVPDCCKKAASRLYSLARYWVYPWSSQKLSENEKDTIDVGVRFSTNLKYVDVSVESPMMSSKFEHVPVDQMVIPLVVSHPEYNAWERLNQKLFQRQQFPVCSIDKTVVMTFDEKRIPLKIGKCWILLAHSSPKPRFKLEGVSVKFLHPESEQMSVVARQMNPSQREMVIMLGKNTIEIQSVNSVKVNREKISLNGLQMLKDDNSEVFAKISSIDGSLTIEGVQNGVQIIYDGYHIKLQVTNSLRNQMRGICGNFDGEDANDMMTPKNCIVNNPFDFSSSYNIDCGKTDLRVPCVKETVLFSDAVQNKPDRIKKGDVTCINHVVKIIENAGEKCFSIRPLVNCKSHCKATKEIEKSVDFYCVSNNEVAVRWVELVKKGGNPDFSQKGPNYRETIKLPESCKE